MVRALTGTGEPRGCRFYEPGRVQSEGVYGLESALLVYDIPLIQGVERLHEARDALEEAAGRGPFSGAAGMGRRGV